MMQNSPLQEEPLGGWWARRRGTAMFLVSVALIVGAIPLALSRPRDVGEPLGTEDIFWTLGMMSLPAVGALIVNRRPRHPVGMVLSVLGLSIGLGVFCADYGIYGVVNPRSVPAPDWVYWIGNWGISPGYALFPFFFLTFPNGALPSRGWRWVAIAAGGGAVLAVIGSAFVPGPMGAVGTPVNPVGIDAPGNFFKVLEENANRVVGICIFVSVAAPFMRYRRSDGEVRQQLKWLAYACLIFGVSILTALLYEGFVGRLPDLIGTGLLVTALFSLSIAIGIAILKYRLYDIDVVINKTIVFGVLAAFITLVYVAIVVGIGTLAGSSDEPNPALSIAATAVVAIAFSPVRDRVQKVANRLVYGKRQTPYEAIARLADEVVRSYETHQVAPAIAQTIADATGAQTAQVWLKVDDTLVCQATHPEDDHQDITLELEGGADLPAIPGSDLAVEVVHNKELLGALSLTKKRGEQPQPQDRKLLDDLSSQAGIVLANARMTAELEAHLAHITAQAQAIKASRGRIVAAQDKERRRLERDIHDGAQQHLVALAVKLNLAKTTAKRKPDKAPALVAQLKDDTHEALATLTDLARGIYPPVLKDRGIAAALELRAQKAPFRVTIDDHTTERYDEATEAAVYFCCLEALQNTAKYANATSATVTLTESDDTLGFVVTDDGKGFDPATTTEGTGTQGMADRLAAVGGALTVTSAPGEGTTVSGAAPIRAAIRR